MRSRFHSTAQVRRLGSFDQRYELLLGTKKSIYSRFQQSLFVFQKQVVFKISQSGWIQWQKSRTLHDAIGILSWLLAPSFGRPKLFTTLRIQLNKLQSDLVLQLVLHFYQTSQSFNLVVRERLYPQILHHLQLVVNFARQSEKLPHRLVNLLW